MAVEVKKLGRLLALWQAKLKNWHVFGSLARLLVRLYVKMRIWHAFGTMTSRHVDHAGTHSTHGTPFRKLHKMYRKRIVNDENY